jgi:hypothetical protein
VHLRLKNPHPTNADAIHNDGNANNLVKCDRARFASAEPQAPPPNIVKLGIEFTLMNLTAD